MVKTAYVDQRLQKGWPGGQQGNIRWDGIPPWAQCFYSSVVMWLTAFVSEPAAQLFARYFDDVETEVGAVGIGEQLMQKHGLPLVTRDPRNPNLMRKDRSGQYWAVHCDAANIYLDQAGVPINAVWGQIPWEEVDKILASQTTPVVLATRIPPSDGHIILLVGISEDGKNYIVRDPYGNGLAGYPAGASGNELLYPVAWLRKWASINPATHTFADVGVARAMWAVPE